VDGYPDEAEVAALEARAFAPGPIIRQHDMALWDDAFAARAEARHLLESMQERVSAAVEEETRHAHAQGLAAGLREGLQRAEQALATFRRELQTEVLAMRAEAPAAVLACVEAIIGALPEEERTERLLRRALAELDRSPGYALMVPPDFPQELARRVLAEHGEDHPLLPVKVDVTLATGELQLASAAGVINIGLAAQLAALRGCLEPDAIEEEVDHEAEAAALRDALAGPHHAPLATPIPDLADLADAEEETFAEDPDSDADQSEVDDDSDFDDFDFDDDDDDFGADDEDGNP
jgi:flagellar biosynthesis/type III secretory pathway protein FliH